MDQTSTAPAPARHWPDGLTRPPYWAYQDPAMLAREQEKLFQGPTWNYLALASEIPEPGDWRATFIGAMPFVVARQADGSIAAFENRCAHRGALICFATFKINRLSQKGGVTVNAAGGGHVSETLAPEQAQDDAYAGIRSVDDDFQLKAPSLLAAVDEHNDRVQQQVNSVFPTFGLVRTRNAIALRHYLPNGHGKTDLHWIYLGYADDTPEMRRTRLRQLNLTGSAGYVSLEDGCIGGFVERGAAAASGQTAIMEMGGHEADSQDNRVSESAIRGFWKQYRALMDV